jgi:hypothetical protein
MAFREIVLLDSHGGRICQERYDKDGLVDGKASFCSS